MESIPPPPPEQLALALAIVKSKPANLDVREHILQVRQFIKTRREPEAFRSPEQFFDSVAFWKQAHDKSEAEQNKLRDSVYELEQCNDMLLARVRAQGNGSVETALHGLTKDRDAGNPTLRARTQLYPILSLPAAGTQISKTLEDSTAPFMRQFYILQKALQRRSTGINILRPAVDLCKRSADEIEGAVSLESLSPSEAGSKNANLTPNDLSRFKAVIQAVESAAALLFQALKKLSASEPARRETNILMYSIVGLYEAIMGTLERYCKMWASTRPSPDFSRLSTEGPMTRSKTNAGWPAQLETEKEGAMQLVSLLSRMITALDPSQTEQQSLIEGFLCILLSRVGKLLCIFHFRDLQLQPELRADPSILPLPAGLVDAELDNQSLDAMCTEAKHLVWLLEGALAVFNACSPASNPEAEGQSSRTRFISSINARIESTLVQAVFGADSDAYGPRLQCPTLPESLNIDRLLKSHGGAQLSVPDWYMGEVWRLMGWNMLTSKLP
ncbi:hypothetical protein BJX68DRAFT_274541 [Aspergillus pseudodeflectus]|uniref:Uncharacterized protein n=1 Tax=Aspergillus pseudodeflectus TaxID=176178 RepID=A0ABR4J8K8_9EURO